MLITKNYADEKLLYELKKTYRATNWKSGRGRSREETHRRQNRLRGDQRRINDLVYSQSRKRISRLEMVLRGRVGSARLVSFTMQFPFTRHSGSPWRNFPGEARQCDGTRKREKYQGSCFPSGNSIWNEIKPRFHRGVNATSRISLWAKRGRNRVALRFVKKCTPTTRTTGEEGCRRRHRREQREELETVGWPRRGRGGEAKQIILWIIKFKPYRCKM